MRKTCVAMLAGSLAFAAATAVTFAVSPRPVTLAEEGKHDHGHGEKEHKHEGKESHKEGEEHEGERSDLGTQKAGDFEVQVTQVGHVEPGKEAIFVIKPKGKGEPKAVRAWVGVESGQGSIKTKAEEEKKGEWHAHHQVSKPLPAKSKLWVELDTASGKQRASFTLHEEKK